MSLFLFGNNFYKNKQIFKIFAPQILEVYGILLVKTTLESIMLYYTLLFKKGGGASFIEQNRTLGYLKHNFPWDRLISCQTDNLLSSYSQDFNPPDYLLRGYLKGRVFENNPQTREDIIRREIRSIPPEMLNKVVDNFNVRVAAVLSYGSAMHRTNIVLITEKV